MKTQVNSQLEVTFNRSEKDLAEMAEIMDPANPKDMELFVELTKRHEGAFKNYVGSISSQFSRAKYILENIR